MKNNSTLIWVIVAIVVVVGALFLFMRDDNISPDTDTSIKDSNVPTESVQDLSETTPSASPVAAISYANALIKYKDKRIQLDTVCQAHPNIVTYKDNIGIMIDNRSPMTRTVKVGSTFTIKPWGFKIIVLPDIYLKSKTLLVDCDSSQNVATILVQE